MLKLEFTGDSPDALNAAIKDYVSKLKGTRGGKGEKDEPETTTTTGAIAPPPMMPPPGGQPGAQAFSPQVQGFAPPAPGAAPGGAFPAPGAPTLDPAVQATVARVSKALDGAAAAGQPMDQILGWLRNQLSAVVDPASLAAYNLDQCKAALVKLPMPALENAAKLMNA